MKIIRIQLRSAIQWNFDHVSKSILPISGFHLEWQLLLKVKQVGTPPLREGEERKPFRKESSLQHSCGGAHRGPLGGPMRRQNAAFTRTEERLGVLPWTKERKDSGHVEPWPVKYSTNQNTGQICGTDSDFGNFKGELKRFFFIGSKFLSAPN